MRRRRPPHMVEKIKASGANVVLAQKGIDDVAQHFLAKDGIYAVRRVKESDMKKLAKATGARSVTNLDDLTRRSSAEPISSRNGRSGRTTYLCDGMQEKPGGLHPDPWRHGNVSMR